MLRIPVLRILLTASVVCMAAYLISCNGSDSPTGSGNGGGGNPSPNTINISGSDFTPGGKTFAVGTTVKWVNKDGINHTVTSDNGTFNSGSLGNGAQFSFTFTTAGSYPYHCSIHAFMKDTITITP